MWRDRTNLYISYRQSYSHHPAKKPRLAGSFTNGFSDNASTSEERRGLISAGAFEDDGDAVIEMDLLPPRWIDVQDEVTELLVEVAKNSTKLDRLHQKHILPGFDDEDVRNEEEREIERLTQQITRGFHDCQRAIQRIDTMVRESRQQGVVSRGDETMAKNIQISLAGRVQDASAGFRKKQSTYLKKLRGLGGMASPLDRSSTPNNQNPYSDPSLMESDADKSFSQSTLQQTSQRFVTSNNAAIMQREREIMDIAKGIIELADIFKDLQTMIIDQGTMLDRIDYNVERMTVDVKAADKELTVATGYQKKTTKRKVIFLLVLLVVGMFILLLVKPKRHDGPSPSPPATQPGGESGAAAVDRSKRAGRFVIDVSEVLSPGRSKLDTVENTFEHSITADFQSASIYQRLSSLKLTNPVYGGFIKYAYPPQRRVQSSSSKSASNALPRGQFIARANQVHHDTVRLIRALTRTQSLIVVLREYRRAFARLVSLLPDDFKPEENGTEAAARAITNYILHTEIQLAEHDVCETRFQELQDALEDEISTGRLNAERNA